MSCYIESFDLQVLVAALPASDASCHVRAWIRHVGFAITYGALVMKTWRYVIEQN